MRSIFYLSASTMTTSSISQMSTRGRTSAQSNVILVVLWLFRVVSLRFQCAINVCTTKNWFDSSQLGLQSAQNLVPSPNFGLTNGQFEKLGEPFFGIRWIGVWDFMKTYEFNMVQVQSSSFLFVNWTFLSAGQHFTPKAALLPFTRQSWADPDSQPPLIYQSGPHLTFCPELPFFHSQPCVLIVAKCYSKKFHRKNIKKLKNYFWPNDPRKSNNIDQVTFVKFSWSRSREKSSKISITVFQ